MELKELERSVKILNEVVNEFPIGATSLDSFRPTEERIRMARESLMHLNARLLMLRAKYKQYQTDEKTRENKELEGLLQRAMSDVLINIRTIKLCLHSATILSVLANKEGDAEDEKKLYTYMSKLFTLNDNIASIQQSIEKASQVWLDLKVECQEMLFEHKNFLKEQKEMRSKKLQEMYPETVKNKEKMEKTLRKINIMKQLITNFIAVSGCMLMKKPLLLEMLENHRELINVETIANMLKSGSKDTEHIESEGT